MNQFFSQFARVTVILLMLFTQSAMIEHAIEHSEIDHAEQCSACISADNLSADVRDAMSFSAVSFTLSETYFESQSFLQAKINARLSRAPPHLFIV